MQPPKAHIRQATVDDIAAIKKLADDHRFELGFVVQAALEEAVKEQRLFVADSTSSVIGFVHFRCRKDGVAVIYEIAVAKDWQRKGIGRKLVEAVVEHARKQGCTTLRLKCPIDLEANKFYQRMGFRLVGVEEGKLRRLNVWELAIDERWQFFVGLTTDATRARFIVKRFLAGYNLNPPFNPFERIIISPLFAPPWTLKMLKVWRAGDWSVLNSSFPVEAPKAIMFDSGGFQVQMGKITYAELCERLKELYANHDWADFYVLPDHVPTSRDTEAEIDRKVLETLEVGERFLSWFESHFGDKAKERVVGVVHGRTIEQVISVARRWHELGVKYLAFGSFGTSGPNNSVNELGRRAIRFLQALCEEIETTGQKLHIFGIGNPNYLLRLAEFSIVPTSFDSVGWWKAGGFRRILFFGVPQIGLPDGDGEELKRALADIRLAKIKTNHECPFCKDLEALAAQRWHKVFHNLAVCCEAIQRLKAMGFRQDSQRLLLFT